MAVNADLVGRIYPPTGTFVVGREHVRAFASAVGDGGTASHDVEAARALGHADLVATPTFPIIIALRASETVIRDPELGLDYSRVVHGDQSFAFDRPLVAGDELVVTTTIESVRSMAGNDLVTTRADIETVGGEHVATARTLLVVRGEDS
jgi:acyl dehydratase